MRDRFWGAPRRGYHHGNLRETLIEAARHLIAANGPEGFSLIEAARLAEVSPAAPYRHFPDRRALVAAVGERGFALFGERMAAEASTGGGAGTFRRMGQAYLAFARDEPGYYGAMFEGRKASPQEDSAAGAGAFDQLAGAVGSMLPPGRFDAGQVRIIALEVWALSHGVAMLARNGDLPHGPGIPDAETLLDGAVTALIAGHREAQPGG